MNVRDLVDGQEVDMVLLVRDRQVDNKRNGDEYLKLTLGDRTGTVSAKIWDAVPTYMENTAPGTVIRLLGRYTVHPKYGSDITIRALRPAQEEEIDYTKLLDGPATPIADLERSLLALIETIADFGILALVNKVLEGDTWQRFRDAPAAKGNHHAYRHGLIEHTLEVAELVSMIALVLPHINRDVALAGAVLHDIGKLDVYTTDPLALDYTTTGNLTGEIPLSYYRVRRALEDLGLDDEDQPAGSVLHIIMSHHGLVEHGATSTPATREAFLVHYIDNLSARLGGVDRIEKALPEGEEWSGYDRFLGGRMYLPQPVTPDPGKEQ